MAYLKKITGILGFAVMLGCGQDEVKTSELRVVNGRVALGHEYPEVRLIQGCGGTFIDHNIMVTADHCLFNENDEPMDRTWVYVNGDYQLSTKVAIHPQYSLGYRNGVNKYDVALLWFDEQTSRDYAPVCSLGPEKQMTGTIVGWGCNDVTGGWNSCAGMGVKRVGYTLIRGKEDHMLESKGMVRPAGDTGYQAVSALGDSGGPVYFQGCVGGVVSGGTKMGLDPYSFYTDLTTPWVQKFLKAEGIAIGGEGFDKIDQCKSSQDGVFAFYRLEGDCQKKLTETWAYDANFIEGGIYRGILTSSCDGRGSAKEVEVSRVGSRQEMVEFDIRWSSYRKSRWTPRNGQRNLRFSLDCVGS